MSEPANPNPFDLSALLAFYAEAGVSDALADEAPDRFDEGRTAPAQAAPRRPEPAAAPPTPPPTVRDSTPGGLDVSAVPSRPPPSAAVPDGAQAALARELARSATSLEALR